MRNRLRRRHGLEEFRRRVGKSEEGLIYGQARPCVWTTGGDVDEDEDEENDDRRALGRGVTSSDRL